MLVKSAFGQEKVIFLDISFFLPKMIWNDRDQLDLLAVPNNWIPNVLHASQEPKISKKKRIQLNGIFNIKRLLFGVYQQ